MGTPWPRVFCIGLFVVAFCYPTFSAQPDDKNKPTPAKETGSDDPSQEESREAGPTLPNPVKSKAPKQKTASYGEASPDDAQESPSHRTDSQPTQPTDKLTIDDETPQFGDEIPLVTENILLAPEPYVPTCKTGGRCHKQCRQCCQCNCSPCGCDFDTYLLVDFLFFKRNNATNGAVVAETVGTLSTPSIPVLTTRSTNPGTAPGIRLFGGRLRKNGIGWEFGYTGVFGMFGERTVQSPPDLRSPGGLGQQTGWNDLDDARLTYASSLNMCEVNIHMSRATIKSDPRSPFPWRRVHDPLGANVTSEYEFQWLGGFRWAGFNDVTSLHADASVFSGNNDGTYSITTNSQMLGPQIGFKTKRRWSNWSIQGWTKATLAGTFLNADSAPIGTIASGPTFYRDQTSARDVGVGFIGDMNYSIVRRLNRKWSLRAGYNLIWISGVALAPNQFDFTVSTTSGTTLANTGNVFLHGANLGLEAQW